MESETTKETKTEELDPKKDFTIILDELYYTVSGAMKMLKVGKNTISNSVNDGTLIALDHPSGYLFSKGALFGWLKSRMLTGNKTKKEKKKK